MTLTLRPATADDFPFCQAIYFTEMDQIMTELGMDKARHRETFKAGWSAEQIQVIALDGRDIGWMQTWHEPDSLYLSQLFIEAPFQNRGVGGEVLTRLLRQTDAEGVPTTLSVVKSNPARRLYERHGFRRTHDDERKFYMQREVGGRRRDERRLACAPSCIQISYTVTVIRISHGVTASPLLLI